MDSNQRKLTLADLQSVHPGSPTSCPINLPPISDPWNPRAVHPWRLPGSKRRLIRQVFGKGCFRRLGQLGARDGFQPPTRESPIYCSRETKTPRADRLQWIHIRSSHVFQPQVASDFLEPPQDWAHIGHTREIPTKNPEALQLRDSL